MIAKKAFDAAPFQFVAAFVDLGIITDHVAHAEDLGDTHAIELGENRRQRLEISMDVRDERYFHGK